MTRDRSGAGRHRRAGVQTNWRRRGCQ